MRSFRRLTALCFCALFALNTHARALSTSASSAILMDADSGRVLYAQNVYEERSIASTTKLMTALTVVEHVDDLTQVVTVPDEAVGVEGSSIYLGYGEQLTIEQLLYGLMLQSGNDAAVALAIVSAGDVDAFVGWMNEKAGELGMTHSHFENPNGLEGEAHYSCAYDMALLARAVLANPCLAAIVSTKSYSFGTRTLTNHNKLLWRYEGCVGLKTGYTQKAGRTLVSAARRGRTTLVAVTLHDPDDWDDHVSLLDYGFQTYHSHLLASAGKTLAYLPVSGALSRWTPVEVAREARYPLTAEEQLTARVQLPASLTAPVAQGQVVGSLTYYLNGEEIDRVNLLSAAAVPADGRHTLRGLKGAFSPLAVQDVFAAAPRYRGAFFQSLLPEGG